jgi:hypothetical protein
MHITVRGLSHRDQRYVLAAIVRVNHSSIFGIVSGRLNMILPMPKELLTPLALDKKDIYRARNMKFTRKG